jgi:hypothetical protein
MGHLDSQRSLPTIGGDKHGFSPTSKKLRLAPGHRVAVLNAPSGYVSLLQPGPVDVGTELRAAQTYDVVQLFVNSADELRRMGPGAIRAVKPEGLRTKRDVLGEITSVTGYKPVAFVAIDET